MRLSVELGASMRLLLLILLACVMLTACVTAPCCEGREDPRDCTLTVGDIMENIAKYQEEENAFNAHVAACSAGNMEECCLVGEVYAQGGKDTIKAERFMSQACMGGQETCCNKIIYLYFYYEDYPRDYTTAIKILNRACDKGYLPACTKSGEWLCQGRGGLYDLDKAAGYFTTACNFGDTKACEELKNIGDCKPLTTEQSATPVNPELDNKYLPDQNYQP